QEAASCEEKGLVPNRTRAVMKKRTSFETGLVQLRRKNICSKQSGSSYTEVEHLRNRRRSAAKNKNLSQTGCVQLRRSNTCSQRDAFNCDQVVRVRNRERSVTSKPASRCCSRILAPGPDPLSH